MQQYIDTLRIFTPLIESGERPRKLFVQSQDARGIGKNVE
jgi:hypothetical protein